MVYHTALACHADDLRNQRAVLHSLQNMLPLITSWRIIDVCPYKDVSRYGVRAVRVSWVHEKYVVTLCAQREVSRHGRTHTTGFRNVS